MKRLDKADFQKAIEKLKKENSLFKQLIALEDEDFNSLPVHLQKDAMKRMGLKKVVEIYWVKDD